MQKRSSNSSTAKAIIASAFVIAGITLLAGSASSASAPNFKVGIQFFDREGNNPIGQLGKVQKTSSVNLAENSEMPSNFAADGNGYDPDGAFAILEKSTNDPILYNFKLCSQMGDHFWLDTSGSVAGGSQFGGTMCTPPAINPDGTLGGGWSPWNADYNGYDFDGGRVSIRTLGKLPAGITISDVQFGLKFSDDACTSQVGTPQYTKWLTETSGESKSPAATDANSYDPDCMSLYLGVKMNDSMCKETVPESQQPKVNQSVQAILGIDGTGTGWKDCGSDSVLTNLHVHNGNGDRKEWDGTCTDTENLIDLSATFTNPNGVVLNYPRAVYPAGDDAWCASGSEVLTGALYYDDDANGSNDEGIRAIRCRKLAAGVTLDYNNIQVFSNSGCGAEACNSYSNTYGSLRTAQANGMPFVPIGMNIRPNDSHKYARGIWAAPLKRIADKSVTCDICKAKTEAVACADQKVLSLANNPGSPGEGTQHAVGGRITAFGVQSIFDINKDLTYEAQLFKIGHNRYGGIITAGVTDLRANGWPSFYASPDGRSLTFRAGRSSSATLCKGNCHEYTLANEIPVGQWTHVAVTVANGQTLTWYINGVQVKQEALAGWDISATPALDKVYLGNEVPGAPEYPNTKLDEVRVWSVVRTADQIRTNMTNRLVGNETGLLDYWNFDGGSLNDLTGHTTALELKNGASITADPAIVPLKLCTNTLPVDPSCSACVAGGRELIQPLSLPLATVVTAGTPGPVIGMECAGSLLISGVSTEYANHKKIVNGTCIAVTPGFFTTAASTFITTSNAYNGTYSCPAGSVIGRFVEGGVLCRPIAGGSAAFVPGSERTIALGAGNAVNNYFAFMQNGSNKIWAPVSVTYQGGVPAQKSVKVAEVRTAPSCTQLPPVVNGALRVHRMFRNADGTPGAPAASVAKAGINQNAMISDQPAVFLQLFPGPYPVFVTDLPGDEKFSICQFAIGGSGCSGTTFTTIPATNCIGGVCALPATPVSANKMTAIVVTYEPSTTVVVPPLTPPTCSDGIDNDNDGVSDANDSDCQSGNPGGERAPQADTCTFTATPSSIVLNIGSSKLEWVCSTGPANITDDNTGFTDIGQKDKTGFVNVAPDKTTTFTLRAGTVTKMVTVNVGDSFFDEGDF